MSASVGHSKHMRDCLKRLILNKHFKYCCLNLSGINFYQPFNVDVIIRRLRFMITSLFLLPLFRITYFIMPKILKILYSNKIREFLSTLCTNCPTLIHHITYYCKNRKLQVNHCRSHKHNRPSHTSISLCGVTG